MRSSLLDRYLLEPAFLNSDGVAAVLPDQQNPEAQAARLARRTYDRAALSTILTNYNLSIGGDEATQANCLKLAEPQALTVVTGQQAGLFSGPLYTVYKIITAIKLAARWEHELGQPVVPIFWNATEDHDLSEIAAFEVPGRTWRAPFPDSGLAAERLESHPACIQVVNEYLATLTDMHHREAITALIQQPFINYGLYSSAIISKLFAGTGLIVLEPHLLRPLAKPYLLQAVGEREAIREAMRLGAEQAETAGVEPAFTVDRGFGLFHIAADGRRRRVIEKQGMLLYMHEWIAPEAVLATIEESPESWSTAAYLRPVIQSLVLPTLSYVAGPGELKYHLQLGPLFAHFGAPLPLMRLRNHATLVTAKETKLMEKLKMSPGGLFEGPAAYYNQAELPERIAAEFDAAEEHLEAELRLLAESTRGTANQRRFCSFQARLSNQFERLRQSTRRDYQVAAGVGNARVDRLFAVVRPRNNLQERALNIMPFIATHGPGLIPELMAVMDPFEARHYLIDLG